MLLLLLSQPWGVSRCAPGNIACTGIWKVPALRGIKVCTGEHCVHWMINSQPCPPPRVPLNLNLNFELETKFKFTPRVPTLPIMKLNLNLNLNLNFELELETKFKFTPRVPNPPPRVPTLPFLQGPHPTNFETQLNTQTRNQLQFFPPGSPPYQI